MCVELGIVRDESHVEFGFHEFWQVVKVSPVLRRKEYSLRTDTAGL